MPQLRQRPRLHRPPRQVPVTLSCLCVGTSLIGDDACTLGYSELFLGAHQMHTISMSIQCIHTNLAHTLHWIIIVYTYLKCMNFQSYSDCCALSIIIWVRCGARHMIYYHSTLLMFCDVINFQFASAATTAAPPPATTPGHRHFELLVRWQQSLR